jgi:hypothetical protein
VFSKASVDVIQSWQQIPVLNLHHFVECQQQRILLEVWEYTQLMEQLAVASQLAGGKE